MFLDRRVLLAGLGTSIACPALASSTTVDLELMEIAWLIAGLTPLGRNGEALSRDTAYWRAVEAWFAPYAAHAVVKALGAEFNLPRWIGNAANYRFVGANSLQRSGPPRPMWGDAEGDLFTRFRQETESFVEQSRARAFLGRQAETLASVRKTLFDAVDPQDMQTWLEREFSARPGPMEILVSPVTGGWNFTNLDASKPRLWVPAVSSPATAYRRFIIVGSIFTEMDHNYVNPATSRLLAEDYDYFTLARGWASPQAWSDYNSPELVLNEYMTWATYLFYARDYLGGDDLRRTEDRTVRFMEKNRGFPKFGLFLEAITKQRAVRRATLEECYLPTLVRLWA